jgi:hypothetical protein
MRMLEIDADERIIRGCKPGDQEDLILGRCIPRPWPHRQACRVLAQGEVV